MIFLGSSIRVVLVPSCLLRVSAIALATAEYFVYFVAKHPFRLVDHLARHLADAFGLGDLAPCAAILAISNRKLRNPSKAERHP